MSSMRPDVAPVVFYALGSTGSAGRRFSLRRRNGSANVNDKEDTMYATDRQLPSASARPSATTPGDGIEYNATPPPPALAASRGTGVYDGHAERTASPADGSPRITAWLADGGLGAAGPLRTVREVQDAAARVVEMTGAGGVLRPTAFVADDGRVYTVRVIAVVEEAEPEVARAAVEDAQAACPEVYTARRGVPESHLRHRATR
jgi:hypothetical protein